jgi:hypothetical protein
VKQDKIARGQSAGVNGDERAKLTRLRAKHAELRMERDILKVRREALCRIPDVVGRDLENHPWA